MQTRSRSRSQTWATPAGWYERAPCYEGGGTGLSRNQHRPAWSAELGPRQGAGGHREAASLSLRSSGQTLGTRGDAEAQSEPHCAPWVHGPEEVGDERGAVRGGQPWPQLLPRAPLACSTSTSPRTSRRGSTGPWRCSSAPSTGPQLTSGARRAWYIRLGYPCPELAHRPQPHPLPLPGLRAGHWRLPV